jgi:D-beta-D-heptose 7-phosphate kinase/D-beta-D-heptose 1-phosphate adenosyltransferase
MMFTLAEADRFAGSLRAAGKRVVFTNGVFDILHPGHVRYLEQARQRGDGLIVGVNSDASVGRIKGPDRPITPAAERAEILSALACVDRVTVFDEDTPLETIVALQPDVLVKGADWAADAIVGRETVEARGGQVIRVTIEKGHSTTAILERIRATGGQGRPSA